MLLGNVDILSILLSCPSINVNQQDLSGQTALLISSCQGHWQAVQALLAHPETNPNIADHRGVTPLLSAVLGGHSHVVSVLLAQEAIDINFSDGERQNALMLASSMGQAVVVAKLLEFSRLCLEEVSIHGKTAARLAREKGHQHIVDMLEKEILRRRLLMTTQADNVNLEQKLSEIQL